MPERRFQNRYICKHCGVRIIPANMHSQKVCKKCSKNYYINKQNIDKFIGTINSDSPKHLAEGIPVDCTMSELLQLLQCMFVDKELKKKF